MWRNKIWWPVSLWVLNGWFRPHLKGTCQWKFFFFADSIFNDLWGYYTRKLCTNSKKNSSVLAGLMKGKGEKFWCQYTGIAWANISAIFSTEFKDPGLLCIWRTADIQIQCRTGVEILASGVFHDSIRMSYASGMCGHRIFWRLKGQGALNKSKNFAEL